VNVGLPVDRVPVGDFGVGASGKASNENIGTRVFVFVEARICISIGVDVMALIASGMIV